MKQKHALILALLITILIATNISFLKLITESPPNTETVIVSRVIDGDTLVLEDGRTLRLQNINTPEKNTPNYELSMNFLKQYENKTIEMENLGQEKYNRTLARIYAPTYLNLELVEKGLSAKAWVKDDEETKLFAKAEAKAIEQGIGIWKHSSYYNCFESEINEKQEIVILKNKCSNINIGSWIIKDESTKTLKFSNQEIGQITIHSAKGENDKENIFWNAGNVWNNDRDTLYLFDENGNIAHYHSYGY